MKRLLVCFAAVIILAAGCNKPPFRIGFVGGLTGKMSDLGISGRNSLQLAVSEINAGGGINGRPAELIVRNNENDPKQAEEAVRELIDSGVDVIVGHMVSSMSIPTVPIINEHHIVMISPTTSTPELSGKDDYFFRVMPENTVEMKALVDFAVSDLRVQTISSVIDLSNEGYSVPSWDYFKNYFISRGGQIITEQEYNAKTAIDYGNIIRKVDTGSLDGLVLISNAFDTAMFCQQLTKQEINVKILSCGWAMTEDLLQYGGEAVEGLFFAAVPEPAVSANNWRRFKEEYREHYGEEPDFAAINAYDAVMVVRQAYEQKQKKESLKDAITRIGTFDGLQYAVRIDEFGDAMKDYHILTIQNGSFVAGDR
jgi:branched-chain amino acid transport system substrate-binding protein